MAQLLMLFLISTFIVFCFWLIKLVYERSFHIKNIIRLRRDIKRIEREIKLLK